MLNEDVKGSLLAKILKFILLRILAGILQLGNIGILPGGGRGDNESSLIQVTPPLSDSSTPPPIFKPPHL